MVEVWHARGATIKCADGPRDNGILTPEELWAFASAVRETMPTAAILVHAYGLRAIEYDNDKQAGPRLDWGDWE